MNIVDIGYNILWLKKDNSIPMQVRCLDVSVLRR